jgi:hypothetical protein
MSKSALNFHSGQYIIYETIARATYVNACRGAYGSNMSLKGSQSTNIKDGRSNIP